VLREYLRLEWERRRGALLLVAAVCFLVPVISFVTAGWGGARADELKSGLLDSEARGTLLLGALWVAALAWGAGAWRDERRGGWVYSLSLPVGRVQLFGLRYLSGLVWLALPLAVLGITAAVVAALADLPPGVYAYPGAFFRWCALTMWLMYTGMFVLAASVERPWTWVLGGAVAFVALNVALVLGTFPTLAFVAEMVNEGSVSPLRPLRDPQFLFAF
jgi:hypothetical protein